MFGSKISWLSPVGFMLAQQPTAMTKAPEAFEAIRCFNENPKFQSKIVFNPEPTPILFK